MTLAFAALIAGHLMADPTLVATGTQWRYLDDGSDPGTAWRAPGFNDAGWAWGAAQLGYGDGDETTVIGFGPNPSSRYITTYFRKTFSVADASLFSSLNLRVLRDDGVAVYLNGTEVFRNNLPSGTLTSRTLAPTAITGSEESTSFIAASLGTTTLTTGNNVLAVEIHQQSASSSDVSFDLELVGVVPGQPSLTRGPYLQKSTPNSMVLRWRTSSANNSWVRFGTSAASLDRSASDPTPTTEHSITLSELTPNTLYYYAVGDSTGMLAAGSDYFFYTPPPVGTVQPMRFWILGDAGTGASGQVAVRNAYYNFSASRYTDLVLLLGDNAYNSGTDTEYQSRHFGVYQSILRSTASFSTIGNHDTAQLANPDVAITPYFQIFDHPAAAEGGGIASGTGRYYSFNYGNIHFVCLDSMTSDRTISGPMLTWLAQDLGQNTADWLIAFFHHPPYTKGSHNSDNPVEDGGRMTDMRAQALPILEANGVDLVLSGHSHSYERSYLLDGHYGFSTNLVPEMILNAGSGRESGSGAYSKDAGPQPHQGAVYVVAGSAGKISGGTLDHPAMFVSLNQLGSFVVDVNGSRLDACFLTSTGTTNDSFTLIKGPPANVPPSVLITAPTDGTTLIEGTPIAIQADTLDSDGTVSSVTFIADGIPQSVVTEAPFAFSWQGATVGLHVLTAVAADNAGALGTSPPVTITIVSQSPPSPPSSLAATAVSSARINLSWTDNSSNESVFRMERSVDGVNFSLIGTASANATTFSDTTVAPATTYSYRILAGNSGGDSAYSNIAMATTPDVPPTAPTNLVVIAPTTSATSLSWTDTSANETGFYVERSTNGVDWVQIKTLPANTTTFYNTAGIVSGTTYLYRLRTFNSAGTSPYSGIATVTVPAAPPAAPSNLAATSPRTAAINLTWTDTAGNETGFKVERSVNGSDWAQIKILPANTTSFYNTSGVISGITYFYRIRAYNAAGDSAYSGTVQRTAL